MRLGFDYWGNQLLDGARGGRGPSYIRPILYIVALQVLILAVSIALGLLLFVIMVAPRVQAGMPLDPNELVEEAMRLTSGGPTALALALPQFLLMIGGTWAWVKWVERRPFVTIGLWRSNALFRWARGMAVGGGLFLISVALIAPFGALEWQGFAPAGILPALLWTAGTLLFFIIQGPAEEIMARGYLMPTLSAKGGIVLGAVISSAIFALGHLLNPNVSAISMLNLFLYGILTALYALREESLWGVFGLHTAWNWLQGNVLGLPVSGADFGPAPLFDLNTTNPVLWSGGAFGPEGGIVVTITTLAAIAALLFWRRLWSANSHMDSAPGSTNPYAGG